MSDNRKSQYKYVDTWGKNERTGGICQEHHEAVNTNTPAASWGKPMLKTEKKDRSALFRHFTREKLTHQRKSRQSPGPRHRPVPFVGPKSD